MDIFKLGDKILALLEACLVLEQSDIPGLCNAWTVTGQFQGSEVPGQLLRVLSRSL